MTQHLYHLTLRPASIGCYPDRDNAGNRLEAEIIVNHWPPKKLPDGRNHYATVAYPEPLEFERIWRYDLLPAAKLERARYGFWEYYDRKQDMVDRYLPLWLAQPRAALEAMQERDVLAEWTLTILDAEPQP